eukprot:Partr_v1_DN27015_c0_g1_i5_m28919 putative ste20-related kinase adaptor
MTLSRHKNLLPVLTAFVHKSKLYIVTPYLSAGSCLNIIKTAFPSGLDEVSIATILKECLQGMDYLHKNRHIHRDIKAGNLLVDENGSVLLADFGVSSSLMEHGERKGQRRTFVGTPCWMAPEVLTPEKGYDLKADIWSFGITALELATGQAPYAKFPPLKVLMLTLQHDPPSLDREGSKHKFSKNFSQMIDLCLQKDPTRRPSAEDLLKHPFFRQARKKEYLVKNLLQNLPPLRADSTFDNVHGQSGSYERGVSWDFDGMDHNPPITSDPVNFLEDDSLVESTMMYDSLNREARELPVIQENDESSDESQSGTMMRRGRFNVSVQKIEAAAAATTSDNIVGGVSTEKRGRFAVKSVAKDGHSRGMSSSSSSSLSISREQKSQLTGDSARLRALLSSGQCDQGLLDEIAKTMMKMEMAINVEST